MFNKVIYNVFLNILWELIISVVDYCDVIWSDNQVFFGLEY